MKRTLSVLLAFIIFVFASANVSVTVYADNAANLAAHQVSDEILQNYVNPEAHLDKYSLTETEEAELLAVAQEAAAGCSTDYEIISAVTRFIADEIYYDYDYYDGRTTTLYYRPYEVWTNKRTVCEGYARLTKELLNLLNIPCMCILAENHKYNGAYDSDNDRWIYLDTTWASGNTYEYGEFEKGTYSASRFDMTIEKLSSLSNHQVYGVSGIVVDNMEYELVTPKTKDEWANTEVWSISVNGVTDDFASAGVEFESSIANVKVTVLNESAFSGCDTITTAIIPEGITAIKNGAFLNCTNLTSVSIPDSVTTIASTVFKNCTSLETVVIPDSVTSLGNFVFRGCTSLRNVTLPKGLTSIGSALFRECTSLAGITIPEGVTEIGSNAFYGCTSLASISLPQGVTNIDSSAFRECTGLTSFVIPDGVTSISNYLFYKCSGLTSVTIPDGVTSIGASAFYGCTGLTSIPIPEKVTEIGSSAFYGCSKVKSFDLPEGITSIEQNTFRGCKALTAIELPESVTSIGYGSFYDCMALVTINIPDNVTEIGGYAFFQCCELEAIDIPEKVTTIGMCAFHACDDLSEVVIPASVESIGTKAFQTCLSLTSVTIADGVQTIGDYAFRHCPLKSVVIPKSVTSMGDYVFQGCGSLKKVVMYDNLTSIGVEAVTAPTVIYCYENSAAQSYAVENNISYVPIKLTSVSDNVNVDFTDRIIFSSENGCNDISKLVSMPEGCEFNAKASLSLGGNQHLGTGTRVIMTVGGQAIDEYIVVVEGDVNGDSVCDVLDASRAALAVKNMGELDTLQIYAANGRADETIDAATYQNVVNKAVAP